MYTYDTVTQALTGLKQRGFTIDFNIAFDQLKCIDTDICLLPSQFEITEYYRFEGASNPSDQEVVYAVVSKDGTIKGALVSAFGIYSDEIDGELLQKLTISH